jgi:NAD(P)-dependent dehydrogenase (short-subunit alcohol dehydrogenase family)
MPLPFLFHIAEHGLPPWLRANFTPLAQATVIFTLLVLVKVYTLGAKNPITPESRPLHGKVILLTGGTSGIGASVALDLASRGAQLILLTHSSPGDPFVAEHVADLRARSGNQLIYAEHVDLASLRSVRAFATRWLDNLPPRRLDMVVLCAATLASPGSTTPRYSQDGDAAIEETWMVNYLANFHLLGLLSPALRVQPFDRDVRIVLVTCSAAYISAPSLRHGGGSPLSAEDWTPGRAYAHSKLALMTFGRAFQKHLDAYKRPDGLPMTARVVFVDPGLTRTPGMRRWLTRGSLWWLAVYLVGYAVPWFLLKSPDRGAQSVVYAMLEPALRRLSGGRLIKECREVDIARPEVDDEEVAKMLWEGSDKLIELAEREDALKRAREKEREGAAKKEQEEKKGKAPRD